MNDVAAVQVRALGPLAVVGPAGSVSLPARKPRRLLAALLLEPGQSRSVETLIHVLWDDEPPASAVKLVHVYVSQLRKVLPAEVAITTVDGGYALRLAAGATLDSHQFAAEVAEARRVGRDDPARAAALLRTALARWRGAAFADLADCPFGRAEREGLDELRLAATEERIDNELASGRHREVLAEVVSFARHHPLRERLQGLAMIALYRAGSQAEALELYRGAREQLVEELGVEPGPALREVHLRVLRQDPDLLSGADTATAPRRLAALPSPTTSLLGRERELGTITELLGGRAARLVVLTGPGGAGKTRLAVEAARAAAAEFADGAVFVPLAAVQDPESLLPAVATALGVSSAATAAVDALAMALHSREQLLVLDNIEQLRDGAVGLVELLARAPRVTILATSRVVLRLTGEHVVAIGPLDGAAAVALFADRARAAGVMLDSGDEALATVAQICHRLDSLPLAIELAAGQTRLFTPEELLERLSHHLAALGTGPRDLPSRQRTLTATIAWSVDQLAPEARDALTNLAVFAGGWTLAAAQAVCGTTPEQLEMLVDHSLVARGATGPTSRYTMLETVREYAAEQLAASPGDAALRRRHAEHMLRFARELGLATEDLGRGRQQRFDDARAEQANLRAALDWAVTGDPELGIRLMLAVEQFWVATAPAESVRRMAALLAAAPGLPPALHARALLDLGGATQVSGDQQGAWVHYEASRDAFRALGDEVMTAQAEHRLGTTLLLECRYDELRPLVERWLAWARAGGHRYEEAGFLDLMGEVHLHDGDAAAAHACALRSLELTRAQGGWPWGEAAALRRLCRTAARLGDLDAAAAFGQECLALSHRIGDGKRAVMALAELAIVARLRGDDRRAGHLWGAIEAEEQRTPLGWWQQRREQVAPQITEGTGAEFALARRAGLAMTLEQATAVALEVGGPAPRPAARRAGGQRAGA